MRGRFALPALLLLGALLAAPVLAWSPAGDGEEQPGGSGGGGRDTTPAFDIRGSSTVEAFVGDCVKNGADWTALYRATSSTRANRSAYYLAVKTTLSVGGVVRGSSPVVGRYGPVSTVSATYSYTMPCQSLTRPTSVSGWHKGRLNASSDAIFSTSSG